MTKRLTGSITITILLILTLAASIKALVQANNVDKKDIMDKLLQSGGGQA